MQTLIRFCGFCHIECRSSSRQKTYRICRRRDSELSSICIHCSLQLSPIFEGLGPQISIADAHSSVEFKSSRQSEEMRSKFALYDRLSTALSVPFGTRVRCAELRLGIPLLSVIGIAESDNHQAGLGHLLPLRLRDDLCNRLWSRGANTETRKSKPRDTIWKEIRERVCWKLLLWDELAYSLLLGNHSCIQISSIVCLR